MRWQSFAELGEGFPEHCICSESAPNTVSPIAKIHRSRNRGVEMGVITLTIIPSNPQAKVCLSLLELYAC